MQSASLLLLSALLPLALAKTAIDVPFTQLAQDQLSCLRSQGHSGFIGRVWNRNNYDMHGFGNIISARKNGFDRVDGVFLPCYLDSLNHPCIDGSKQMESAITQLATEGAVVNFLWIYLDESDWSKDQNANRAALSSMVFKAKSMGQKVGIGARKESFEALFGADYTAQSGLPLWWNVENGQANLDNFVPFNGWAAPVLHEYGDIENERSCGHIPASVVYYA